MNGQDAAMTAAAFALALGALVACVVSHRWHLKLSRQLFDAFCREYEASTETILLTHELVGRVDQLRRVIAMLLQDLEEHDRWIRRLAAATAGIDVLTAPANHPITADDETLIAAQIRDTAPRH